MKLPSFQLRNAIVIGMVALVSPAYAEDCPQMDTAKAANAYRTSRTVGPRAFAQCLSGQIGTLPISGEDLPGWLGFYTQSIVTLRNLYLQEDVGTAARDTYSAKELALRARYREALANQLKSEKALSAEAAKKIQKAYATSLAEEYDLIYRRSLEGIDSLGRAHELLLNVDPFFLFDQTGKNWAGAIGTCPDWKPGIITKMDKLWCDACRPEFEKANDILEPWAASHPPSEVRTTVAQLRVRTKQIADTCKD